MNYDNYYKNGGMTKEESVSAIALRIGAKKEAVAKFVEKHNIDTNKLNSDLKSGEVYFIDVITAIVGKPDNKYEKQIVKKYGNKMAMGGKTQGYDDREDERLGMEYGKMSGKDFDGSHAMKEHSRRDDARFEERMARGGKIDEKEKLSNISYQLINTTESFKKNNPEAYSRMKDEYKAQFIKVYGKDEYAKRHIMADGGYVIFEGQDHHNNKPLYKVISKDEDNDYVGEFHDNREDAEKELNELKNKNMHYDDGGMMDNEDYDDEISEEMQKLLDEHEKEAKKNRVKITNLGSNSGDDYIASKTTQRKDGSDFLTSEINEGKVTHYWEEYAQGGVMDDGGEIPNTVREFENKVSMYYAKMNEAEKNYMDDDGASYHKAIEDRDNYILNTKKAWYENLSEAEKNGNSKRYEMLLKMINDAGLYRYAKGGMMAEGGVIEIKDGGMDSEGDYGIRLTYNPKTKLSELSITEEDKGKLNITTFKKIPYEVIDRFANEFQQFDFDYLTEKSWYFNHTYAIYTPQMFLYGAVRNDDGSYLIHIDEKVKTFDSDSLMESIANAFIELYEELGESPYDDEDEYAKGGMMADGGSTKKFYVMQDTKGFIEQGFWGVIDGRKNELIDIFEFKKEADGFAKELNQKGKANANDYNGQIQNYANGGEVLKTFRHKHIPTMTYEVVDYTSNGYKGIQKDSKSLSAKERKEGKIAYYSKSEIKELFDEEFAKGGMMADGGMMARGGYVTDLDEVIASSDLKEELKSKMKEGDKIVAFAYTDYGGSFGDKVAIEYFKENHPKNIVFENSAYNGQNGIVFGEVAKDFLEETEDYPLGYEDMESFYYDMQNAQEEKDFELFLSDIKNKYTIKKDALDWLLENKMGYYSIEPNMVDFSYSELENELEEEGLIKKKKMADGGHIVEHDRIYNFLEDDLQKLQNAIEGSDFEEVNRFFSYWGRHLKSLETKTNKRTYNFLEDDLQKLQNAIEEGDTEEVNRFFSYWGQNLQFLRMADGRKTEDYFEHFDFNAEGNFAANLNGKNYEIIYRDDKSQMYDLFEDGKKIKSNMYFRNLTTFAKGGAISNNSTYVPNRDIKDLSLVLKGELKKLKGSDIFDGVYVKNKLPRKKVEKQDVDDAQKIFDEIIKKYKNDKYYDAKDEIIYTPATIQSLLDIGLDKKDIMILMFGYGYIEADKIKCDNSFRGYLNGLIGISSDYKTRTIDKFLKDSKMGYFEMGLKYPSFDWQKVVDLYNINLTPKIITTESDKMTNNYEVWTGDGVAIGHQISYQWKGEKLQQSGDEIGVVNLTKPTKFQIDREYPAGFNGGYWGIIVKEKDDLYRIIQMLVAQKSGYLKDLEVFVNGLGGIGSEDVFGEFAKGGEISEQNEMNKKVLALVQKAKIDSKLEFGQLVVSALTDANAHSEVRKFISIIEKKPEWAEKPKEIDMKLPREEFQKQRAKTVYGSKYYDANEKINDLGIKIANMSGWEFETILDSLIFASEMSGRKDVAQVLEKLNTDDDIDYSKQTTDDFTLGEIVWDVDNERYGTVIGIYDDDGFASSKFELRLDSDGVQPTENLRKVGDKGDKGTKKQLDEAITQYARLVKLYGKDNDYPKQIKPDESKDDDKPKNKWEYTDKDEIEYVVVKDKSGKELKFDGKYVISGVHDLLEKGGKLTEIGKYYSKNDVVSVFVNGKNILDKNTVSGVWIQKDAKPMAEDVAEMKIGKTSVTKGVNGWKAKTMVDNFKGFDWDITTIKNSRGDLTTTAQGGKSEDKGGFKMFTFLLYQDPSIRLKTSRPARVNEKVVSEQHAEAMKDWKERQDEVAEMVDQIQAKKKMADGGAIGFDALAKKVAKNYEGDKVKKEFQDEYGKKYDKKEAEEVGKKVAGKVYRQQQAKGKMAKGGKVAKKTGSNFNRSESKMTKISRKASEIRKANEPWRDAFNRAKAIIG